MRDLGRFASRALHNNRIMKTNMTTLLASVSIPIVHEAVRDALLHVDRANYCRPEDKAQAYEDHPMDIGYGATISAPHMHVRALEDMYDVIHDAQTHDTKIRMLDIGAGSGYLAVAMALLAGPALDKVVGVEHIPQLVEMARANVERDGKQWLVDRDQLHLICADGRQGFSQHAPYHVVHVGAAARDIPDALVQQLAPGGVLLIPVGGMMQTFQVLRKDAISGKLVLASQLPVRYVPLTDPDKQLRSS